MSSGAPPDLDALLVPIPGAWPAGVDLRGEAVFDDLRRLRREADLQSQPVATEDAARGFQDGSGTSERQGWLELERLVTEVLTSRSKDLQVAIWFLESRVRLEGFAGAVSGLQLVRELMERYWDAVFPLPDPDDEDPLAMRAGTMEWIRDKLPVLLSTIDLAGGSGQLALYHYQNSQQKGRAKDENAEARAARLEATKLFMEALKLAPMARLEQLDGDMTACQQQLSSLEKTTDARLVSKRVSASGAEVSEPMVGFKSVREVLQECQRLVARPLAELRAKAVDEGLLAPADESGPTPEPTEGQEGQEGNVQQPPGLRGTREDAFKRLRAAAAFLLAETPASPTAYLVSRAICFGPVLGHTSVADAQPFPSPPTDIRQRLRTLASEANWDELRVQGERFLQASPAQPWLDVQRYVATALEQLGGDYGQTAAVLRQMISGWLAVLPGLEEAEFGDGTPLANQETLRWLKEAGIRHSAATDEPKRETPPAREVQISPRETAGPPPPSATIEKALSLIRAKRMPEALELLQTEITTAMSGRDRFLRRLDLAEVCLQSSNPALAFPILTELSATIERERLEDWEDRDLLSRAWSALVLCSRQLDSNAEAQAQGKAAFDRLCRLDIGKALSLDKNATSLRGRWLKR